jgi:hypothetical protein
MTQEAQPAGAALAAARLTEVRRVLLTVRDTETGSRQYALEEIALIVGTTDDAPGTDEQTTAAEEPYQRTSGPVHTKFGLTYANFLVLHRAHLQSMPLEWQTRLVDLLEDLDAAYPDRDSTEFEVTTVRDMYVGDLTPDEMTLAGITRGDEDDDEERETVYYDKSGRELTIHDHVGIPVPDPVPHYKHAYLPPDEAAIARDRNQRLVTRGH